MTIDRLKTIGSLRTEGRHAEYLAATEQLVREFPNDLAARIEAAYAQDTFGAEEHAIVHYDAAFRLGVPEDARAEFLLGYGSTLRNVGRVQESVNVLRAAVAQYPTDRALKVFLALSLHSFACHSESVATLVDIVLSLSSGDANLFRYQRALAHYRDVLLKPRS